MATHNSYQLNLVARGRMASIDASSSPNILLFSNSHIRVAVVCRLGLRECPKLLLFCIIVLAIQGHLCRQPIRWSLTNILDQVT